MKLAALLSLALATSCGTPSGAITATLVGVAIVVVGGTLIHDVGPGTKDTPSGQQQLADGGLLLLTGTSLTILSLVDLAILEARVSSDARPQALELTRTAAHAARTGRCATAVALDDQIRVLDLQFHDTVFVRDVAIARCLADTAQPLPATGTDAPPPRSR